MTLTAGPDAQGWRNFRTGKAAPHRRLCAPKTAHGRPTRLLPLLDEWADGWVMHGMWAAAAAAVSHPEQLSTRCYHPKAGHLEDRCMSRWPSY